MNRESLLSHRRPLNTLSVPFLGDTITLREIGAKQRVGLFTGDQQSAENAFDVSCRLLAVSAVADDGNPLLSTSEWSELADSDCAAFMSLAAQAMTLNAITKEAVEDIAKN
jgi:hypothetical protein